MLCRSARRAKSVSAAVRSPFTARDRERTASSPFWLQASRRQRDQRRPQAKGQLIQLRYRQRAMLLGGFQQGIPFRFLRNTLFPGQAQTKAVQGRTPVVTGLRPGVFEVL